MTAIFLLSATFLIYIFIFIKYFNTPPQAETDTGLNEISIVIAAKNETGNVESLINSLLKLDSPDNRYEVIIIDDNSDDDTFQKVESLITNVINFSLFRASDKKYKGKRGALQFGIEKSKYPYIMITDADCSPQPGWIKAFNKKFNKGNDFVFGLSPFVQKNNFINKLACFENLRTHILSFSFAYIGLPYSAAARSFGFRKESFYKIKGYQNTTETLSGDDDLLLREAVKHKMRVGIVTNENAKVFSEAKSNFKGYLTQKSRHTSTSNHYLLKHKLILGCWHLLNILFLFSPFLIIFNSLWSILFLTKIFIDLFVTKIKMKKLNYSFSIFEILYLQISYDLMIIISYLLGSFIKTKWK